MRDLKLVLTYHWYDMIDSGEKPEEYRSTTRYWIKRFCKKFRGCRLRDIVTGDPLTDAIDRCMEICIKLHPERFDLEKYDTVTFYRGYRKDRKSMQFVINDMVLGHGKKEWGALPFLIYFIIKLGERLR